MNPKAAWTYIEHSIRFWAVFFLFYVFQLRQRLEWIYNQNDYNFFTKNNCMRSFFRVLLIISCGHLIFICKTNHLIYYFACKVVTKSNRNTQRHWKQSHLTCESSECLCAPCSMFAWMFLFFTKNIIVNMMPKWLFVYSPQWGWIESEWAHMRLPYDFGVVYLFIFYILRM